jgi:hypothetical protein
MKFPALITKDDMEAIDKNRWLARGVFVLCAGLLLPSPALAQDGLKLPDGAPISATPGPLGTFLLYPDGSAAVIDLVGGEVTVRQVITVSPQVLKTTWKDRMGLTHEVTTDCRNITIAECTKRHDEMLQAMVVLYPPEP